MMGSSTLIPHSGNVKIRDGKIVWIDMGMMGRLTEHDREMITLAIEGVALNDVGLILKAVLGLGEFKNGRSRENFMKTLKDCF